MTNHGQWVTNMISESYTVFKESCTLVVLWIAVVLSTFPIEASAAAEIFEQKCGECHAMTEFEEVLASYDWSNLPLRTWLASHHKPRLQSISLSEAQVAQMENYINQLRAGAGGGTKIYEIVEADEDAVDLEEQSLDERELPVGVLNRDGAAPQVEQKAESAQEVNASDCLNC